MLDCDWSSDVCSSDLPVLKRTGAGAGDFPMEAMRWGFEGWVRVEYDIQPDGKTANQRAVIAYPPLVFRDAAVGILKDARFAQSYRPEGGPGCGGAQQNINFRIP
jgi:outer membrane biosynthesis protein TonB